MESENSAGYNYIRKEDGLRSTSGDASGRRLVAAETAVLRSERVNVRTRRSPTLNVVRPSPHQVRTNRYVVFNK